MDAQKHCSGIQWRVVRQAGRQAGRYKTVIERKSDRKIWADFTIEVENKSEWENENSKKKNYFEPKKKELYKYK